MFSRIELNPGPDLASSDDGRLEVHELLRMRVSSPLVFLSGCETGLGNAWSTAFQTGDDYATLAQAFLHAGAGNVVATLWRIEDEGAAWFAERFYRHLRDHGPPEALALAQRDALRHDRFGAPHHWAGFTVSGTGELVERGEKSTL
jgi:CHAT domain-containing protein